MGRLTAAANQDKTETAIPGSPDRVLWCARLGLVEYQDAFALQSRLAAARLEGSVPDLLLMLEHPPVYTRGRRSTPDELPMGEQWYRMQGIDIVDSDRGGRVTYHGPGQLVGYPIMSLRSFRDDVHDYIRRMERVIIESLARYGIEASLRDGLTGVWTADERKIASIGVHVSRGITTHGFAINVNNDLQPFEWVVPCGIDHCRMASVASQTRREQDLGHFTDVVCEEFAGMYERNAVEVGVEQLLAALQEHSPAGSAAHEMKVPA